MNIKIAFFGTSNFSVFCLEEIKRSGLLPSLIITSPDKPVGRKLILQPNPVKIWAIQNNIEFSTPIKLDPEFTLKLSTFNFQLYLVASYGKIIPKNIIDLPQYGTLNIHPSLLPKYRGPSPLQAQILNDEQNIGVTIMQIDEQVDHGAIVAQKKIDIENWPVNILELKKITAKVGVEIFVNNLETWINGQIRTVAQNHDQATFTKKVEKRDGLIDINSEPYKNYLKYLAYFTWPQTYFFVERKEQKIRVIVKEAEFKNPLTSEGIRADGKFIIKKVLPEGRKEMTYEDFLRGIK